jgi:hypothetical protein
MTVQLASKATDHTGHDPGEAAAAPQLEQAANPLRQLARDRELAQRLDRRLPGRELPDVELRSVHATQVSIRQHLSGRVVIDFLPGGGSAPSRDSGRIGVRQARLIRLQALGVMDARAISVVSAVPEALDLADPYLDPGSLTLCDPELLIADELGLPTQESDARHYRRLTLITRRGRIEKVIFPPAQGIDNHIRQITAWMQAARW